MERKTNKTIMLSGGFDPLHVGHLQMIQQASVHGDVIVVVNSDRWLLQKKGYVFMPQHERCQIIAGLTHVCAVYAMNSRMAYGSSYHYTSAHKIDDDDGTCVSAIRALKPTYFANGGDRTKENVPEQAVCKELGIEMLWGIGGENKPQSSSWLVKNAIIQMVNKVIK